MVKLVSGFQAALHKLWSSFWASPILGLSSLLCRKSGSTPYPHKNSKSRGYRVYQRKKSIFVLKRRSEVEPRSSKKFCQPTWNRRIFPEKSKFLQNRSPSARRVPNFGAFFPKKWEYPPPTLTFDCESAQKLGHLAVSTVLIQTIARIAIIRQIMNFTQEKLNLQPTGISIMQSFAIFFIMLVDDFLKAEVIMNPPKITARISPMLLTGIQRKNRQIWLAHSCYYWCFKGRGGLVRTVEEKLPRSAADIDRKCDPLKQVKIIRRGIESLILFEASAEETTK